MYTDRLFIQFWSLSFSSFNHSSFDLAIILSCKIYDSFFNQSDFGTIVSGPSHRHGIQLITQAQAVA
jgi:hypothetical protein